MIKLPSQDEIDSSPHALLGHFPLDYINTEHMLQEWLDLGPSRPANRDLLKHSSVDGKIDEELLQHLIQFVVLKASAAIMATRLKPFWVIRHLGLPTAWGSYYTGKKDVTGHAIGTPVLDMAQRYRTLEEADFVAHRLESTISGKWHAYIVTPTIINGVHK